MKVVAWRRRCETLDSMSPSRRGLSPSLASPRTKYSSSTHATL
ncbi:hypothetical protein [Thermofilum pendens]|nr:hypothetical protein [Thermofilum pendens]